ncbi:uncharacterized protein LOC132294856 [Cornus florida]|uniref:uncharacterized protein LOC132294856 n=1 Tax=Cornus florida TaxID=4283 RepID=UPI00289B182F|nr:uncharacterized protein LOC132294856 [Cornus florida]
MGTQKPILVDKGFLRESVFTTMFSFANSFWVFFCNFLFNLFGFVVKFIIRFQADHSSQKNDDDQQIDSNISTESESELFGGKENGEFSFVFPSSNSEDSGKISDETESSAFMENAYIPSTSKYQCISNKNFSGFVEEPETMSFTIQELFVGSNDASSTVKNQNHDTAVPAKKGFRESDFEGKFEELIVGSSGDSIGNTQIMSIGFSEVKGFQGFDLGAEEVDEGKAGDSVQTLCRKEVLEKQEKVNSTEDDLYENKDLDDLENYSLGKHDFSNEVELLSGNHILLFDENPDLNSSSDESSISNTKTDSIGDEFLKDRNEGSEPDTPMPTDEEKSEFIENFQGLENIDVVSDSGISDDEAVVIREKAEDSDDEYIELEPNLHNSIDFIKGKDLDMVEDKNEVENTCCIGLKSMESEEKPGHPSSGRKGWDSDSDEEEDGQEILWEHKDLIEQMKMEMKHARSSRGLFTILEESETPKMMDDLKPLKIDEKLEHKDYMEEIQKVYKSYAERMRKLDILNYQTIHAISFLQLKDSSQLTFSQKSSASTIKSLLFPNIWPGKLRRIYADPTLKSINEMHRNLELVYVGQVCLSWEILHWQYGKANKLVEHDSEGYRPYNQVADEFQQFQVHVQRFIEDEKFQGPRVENYVKNRCMLRTLLQVPAVKDDSLKDRKESRAEEKYAILIAMLEDIVEESMRIFWEFLRTDKDQANVMLTGTQKTHVELQNPSDLELLVDVKASLQKKERRFKEIVRSGNCIVKKFQKQQKDKLIGAQFFAQVELRLVARVLNMSRLTTDQLVWCQRKLNRINFVNRKIHVESSFLLFPF